MNKTLKWLGGGLAAAALLLGLGGLYSAQQAEAQPPSPPAVFGGTVMVDGAGAAAGTLVVAMVDGQQCAVATVADGRYQVRVPSTCASAGDTVSFTIGGTTAAESGSWDNTTFSAVNLTATSAPPPAPEPECPKADGMMGGGSDMPSEPGGDMPSEPGGDMPAEPGGDTMMSDGDGMKSDDCPDDGMMDGGDAGMADEMTPEMTPEVGDTGTGLRTTTSGGSFPLAATLALTALALTLGGYAIARRRS